MPRGDIDFLTLSSGQSLGAFLISFWVNLVIAILGAFAISFYFSANTIIYYLMRQEADTTALDDVYLEQMDDEIVDPLPTAEPLPEMTQVADTTGTPPGPSSI